MTSREYLVTSRAKGRIDYPGRYERPFAVKVTDPLACVTTITFVELSEQCHLTGFLYISLAWWCYLCMFIRPCGYFLHLVLRLFILTRMTGEYVCDIYGTAYPVECWQKHSKTWPRLRFIHWKSYRIYFLFLVSPAIEITVHQKVVLENVWF